MGEKKPLDGLRRFSSDGIHDIIMCIKFVDDQLRGLQLVGVKLLALSRRLCWLPLQRFHTTVPCDRVNHGQEELQPGNN